MTADSPAAPRSPRASEVEMTQLVMPQDANNWGTAFGGKVLAWIDVAAAIAAGRHADGMVVTAAMDDVHFIRPIRRGDVVILKARVNYVGNSSMEVGVRVEGEVWGGDRYHALTAYVTFVALDPATRTPRPVPPLLLATDLERRRATQGETRMTKRKELRDARKERLHS